jgi:hypothetical protein
MNDVMADLASDAVELYGGILFTLRIGFRIINDFVHKFILDCTFVDFTVSLLILSFYIVDFNSKMVISTVKP